jgi:hypothetical protein
MTYPALPAQSADRQQQPPDEERFREAALSNVGVVWFVTIASIVGAQENGWRLLLLWLLIASAIGGLIALADRWGRTAGITNSYGFRLGSPVVIGVVTIALVQDSVRDTVMSIALAAGMCAAALALYTGWWWLTHRTARAG